MTRSELAWQRRIAPQLAKESWFDASVCLGHAPVRVGSAVLRQAAERLSAFACGAHTEDVAHPVAVLWRQYVEQALREIIAAGRALSGRAPEEPRHHQLSTLWTEARALLAAYASEVQDPAALGAVDAVIEALEQVTPTSAPRLPQLGPVANLLDAAGAHLAAAVAIPE